MNAPRGPLAPAAWIALATLLAAVLMAARLADPGLWCDEIYTARWTHLSLAGLFAALHTDLHPPLFFVIERAVVRLLGDSEWGLRALPALCGILCVPLAAWAFRPAAGARTAALAALVLAVMPQFLLIARMARYYSLAALLALLAHGAFERLVRAPRAWRWRLAYAASAALLLYTSYLAACVLLAHGCVALARGRARPGAARAWALACVPAAALFAPWLPVLLAQARTAHALTPAVGAGLLAPARMLAYGAWAASASEMQAPWEPWALLGALAALALLTLGLRAAWRDPDARACVAVGGIAAALAVLVTCALAPATPFASVPARALFLWPWLALGLAHAGRAFASLRARATLATAALALAWGIALVRLETGREWLDLVYRTPGREVARALAERVRPGDRVLADDDTGVPWYLARGPHPVASRDPVEPGALAAVLASGARQLWYARLERDGSERTRSAAPIEARLAAWGTRADSLGFLAIPPDYRRWRARLGLSDHRFRILLERWVARPTPRAEFAAPGRATERNSPIRSRVRHPVSAGLPSGLAKRG